jgi:hypothetical protein
MNVLDLRAVLAAHPEAKMHWMLPDKSFVPDHYHITEVGRLQKRIGRPMALRQASAERGGS